MANCSSLNQHDVTPNHHQGQEKEETNLTLLKPMVRNDDHIILPIETLDSPYKDIISSLPQEKNWLGFPMREYQGFWRSEGVISTIISFQNSFKPRPDDILIASFPKCGTTWLKAIIFATINRNKYDFAMHPLMKLNPHDCVHFMEYFPLEDLESLPSPRLLSFHMAYSILPDSMKATKYKIVYICHDPKDSLVSMWHMTKGSVVKDQQFPFSQAFEIFCNGRSPSGPIWEHMLEYWNASLHNPEKILFLKYENMLENPLEWVKKIAEFLGCSFSNEEETEGVPQKIVELCSFKSLTGLDVNKKKHESAHIFSMNHIFFRKGKIGDWRNHMSFEMVDRVDAITREKFEGSGLTLSS